MPFLVACLATAIDNMQNSSRGGALTLDDRHARISLTKERNARSQSWGRCRTSAMQNRACCTKERQFASQHRPRRSAEHEPIDFALARMHEEDRPVEECRVERGNQRRGKLPQRACPAGGNAICGSPRSARGPPRYKDELPPARSSWCRRPFFLKRIPQGSQAILQSSWEGIMGRWRPTGKIVSFHRVR